MVNTCGNPLKCLWLLHWKPHVPSKWKSNIHAFEGHLCLFTHAQLSNLFWVRQLHTILFIESFWIKKNTKTGMCTPIKPKLQILGLLFHSPPHRRAHSGLNGCQLTGPNQRCDCLSCTSHRILLLSQPSGSVLRAETLACRASSGITKTDKPRRNLVKDECSNQITVNPKNSQ